MTSREFSHRGRSLALRVPSPRRIFTHRRPLDPGYLRMDSRRFGKDMTDAGAKPVGAIPAKRGLVGTHMEATVTCREVPFIPSRWRCLYPLLISVGGWGGRSLPA